MQEVVDFSEQLSKCYGRHSCTKTSRIHDDITCLSHDLKPSLLLDYLRPDGDLLQQFLKYLAPINAHFNHREFTILSLCGDVFLINMRTEKLVKPVYIDITKGLEVPQIIKAGTQFETEIQNWYDRHVTVAKQPHDSCPIIKSQSSSSLNTCTLYGWLCGYPVIYWFNEQNSYDLDMISLTKVTITADNYSPDHHMLWEKVR